MAFNRCVLIDYFERIDIMICQALITDYNNNKGWNFNKHGYEYGKKIGYYNFDENGYMDYGDSPTPDSKCSDFYKDVFDTWDEVEVEIQNSEETGYVNIRLVTKGHMSSFIEVKKEDAEQIANIYKVRNKERQNESSKIHSYLSANILDIAENLVNIIEETAMLNWRIVTACQDKYTHKERTILSERSRYGNLKILHLDVTNLKGKKKTEAERQSEKLLEQYREVEKVIDNFVDIVIEEIGVKPYIARAVAWEAIQIKCIDYYGQIWQSEYDTQLEVMFDEMYEQSDNKKDAVKKYVKEVILSNELDIESTKEILMYFLLYKGNKVYEINLCKMFDSFYEKYRSIKEEVNSSDIKSKLLTKQKRRISKYTIDDVDLMTGAEFEEFVGLLFKKMGYSSQVTKQSGDQGLDVIASKNGTKIGIQAKCYSNTVGNSAVQEAVAGKSFYNCDKVIVITNNYFTPAAEELAQSNNVVLWNRDMLKEKIKELM